MTTSSAANPNQGTENSQIKSNEIMFYLMSAYVHVVIVNKLEIISKLLFNQLYT